MVRSILPTSAATTIGVELQRVDFVESPAAAEAY